MAQKLNILVVDDNRSVLAAVEILLKNYFNKVVSLSSTNQVISTLSKEHFDIVLLDMNFTSGINNGNEGLFWLSEIKKRFPQLPVVLFTAYADIDLAVKGIKEGAIDFIVKPWNNAKLIETLLSACGSSQKRSKGKQTLIAPTNIYWGESVVMKRLQELIRKVAVTDANILITGENGTGKDLLAREIHAQSTRNNQPIVIVDMGAITETLFESELFGHVKGSFTDASSDRIGKFEAANNGTLFLDEIGNLPYHLQAKLLTVLQNRSIVRIGNNTPVPVNMRLICATNKNLQDMVNNNKFREDLLYRINTIHIEIPALRERKEDIIPLAEIFLARFCKQYDKPLIRLSMEAKDKLIRHPWYGNIRELEHMIEKAVIINDGNTLFADTFQLPLKKEMPDGAISTLEDMEMKMIQKTIEKNNGNLSAVASQLGITRQTLYNKMKKFGL